MKRFDTKNRFHKEYLGCIIITTLLLIVFYIIYFNFFGTMFPNFVGLPMLVLFLVLDFALAFIYRKVENKRAQSTYYITDNEKLSYHHGGKTESWYWREFSGAEISKNFYGSYFPVQFMYKHRQIKLSIYVDEPAALAKEIIKNIDGYCTISEDIKTLFE